MGCVRPPSSSKLVFELKSYPHIRAALRTLVELFSHKTSELFRAQNKWNLCRSGRAVKG
ncbi:hypothetical protein HMPREF9004_0081 [Schaalia cardiffensis F0333]|uniref:Uncharacterized protein n=1 Tax=Schaalia cardiffensis F0333 TaxID=888050 RepID=N6X757_9ACTO|nr:hypothetical protein HMPREF9004_0081 [Schaalia cardiffensis F0333]